MSPDPLHPPVLRPGTGDILLLCDHASNAVPGDIDLGIDPALLDRHIAIDLGAAALSEALAARLSAPLISATVSRLVIDLNREPDHPGLVPLVSDGHAIPGNQGVDTAARMARFHAPYHAAIAAQLRRQRPVLIAAIHSFTPELESGGGPRRWEVGVLYNRDVRAARIAVALLEEAGVVTGDNQPYSGRHLNATLNRHAEANGIASLGVEVRQDLIATAAGIARWADILVPVLTRTRNRLAQTACLGT